MEAHVSAGVTEALTVRRLTDVEDFRELAHVFAVIWEKEGVDPVSADVFRALAHAGNYVAAIDGENGIAAGLMGFLAMDDAHHLHLHSHILGVLPSAQLRGAGFALKQDQREWALDRDIDEITWTFDPLVRRNGYFNVAKLGADVEEFLPDFYGAMGDSINGRAASDRALAVWRIGRGRGVPRPEPDIDALLQAGAAVVLDEDTHGEPVVRRSDGEVLLARAPADIVALRQSRPDSADRWTHAFRTTAGSALAGGYRTTGMSRSGWYVLERAR